MCIFIKHCFSYSKFWKKLFLDNQSTVFAGISERFLFKIWLKNFNCNKTLNLHENLGINLGMSATLMYGSSTTETYV